MQELNPEQNKQKINYQKKLDEILKKIVHNTFCLDSEFKKPTLLLHACCAPCSSYVIEYLSSFFDITIFYYNPNIHPQQEYERRLSELENFIPRFKTAVDNKVKLITSSYNQEDFFKATNVLNETALQTEQERGERCRRCYLFRMRASYEYALKNHFDWFTTTLSISPYKDADKINNIGNMLEAEANQKINYSSQSEQNKITKFLTSDFKKRSGFLRSLQLSKEFGLYRQDYCGCIYSKKNMHIN